MGKTRLSVFNSHTSTFLSVVLVSVLLISVYMMIAPEPGVPYNFDPFPKEAPVDLPDPSRHTDTCWNKLTPCDEEGMCSACSLGEYKCLHVTKEEGEKKRYHFNGINVPEGKWCVPKDDNPNPTCNEHTGRWLWVFDEEYCAKVNNGKSQCWKCECLYPSIYSDPENGCNTKQVCQNTSIRTKDKRQPSNSLQGSEFGMDKYAGKTWDPTKADDSGILSYSPYDKDSAGNPLFKCQCDSNAGNQYFTRLDNDPYKCHLEPCYGYFGNQERGLNANGVCECGTNTALSPSGKWKNTCVLISGSCGNYGYDKSSGVCTCGGGPWWPTECKSSLTGVKMERDDLKECLEPENALGSECRNPCEEQVCEHNTVCTSIDAWTSKCDCNTGDPAPHPWQWSGKTCANRCLKDGTIIKKRNGFNMNWCYRCSCCCSEDWHRTRNVLSSWYKEVCKTGSRPDPQGSGPCGYKCGPSEIHGKGSC